RAPCSLFIFICPATPEIYTLSLHDALPIYQRIQQIGGVNQMPAGISAAFPNLVRGRQRQAHVRINACNPLSNRPRGAPPGMNPRSEEHTSELQSLTNLVCRLLLETKTNDTC